MSKIPGREVEARDAARAAFGMPVWTVATTAEDLDSLAKLAGFTGSAILGVYVCMYLCCECENKNQPKPTTF
jgi:hypothetical protein